jgi:hypothetical protein
VHALKPNDSFAVDASLLLLVGNFLPTFPAKKRWVANLRAFMMPDGAQRPLADAHLAL